MKLPNQSKGTSRSTFNVIRSQKAFGVSPSQSLFRLPRNRNDPPFFPGLGFTGNPTADGCTKWCQDCQNCDTYCCECTDPDYCGDIYVHDRD